MACIALGFATCPSLQVSFVYFIIASLKNGLSRFTVHVPHSSCLNTSHRGISYRVHNMDVLHGCLT